MNLNELNELIIKNSEELTAKQKEFLNIHSNILTSGSVISNGLVSLSQNLKKMRDEKLFLEAGFDTFENYSENACGLKRRQAYAYIQVLEKLGSEFVHSNAQIGISKLTLLSSLSEDERVEVLQTVEVEDSSVSELKEEIKKLKQDIYQKETETSSVKQKYESKLSKLKDEVDKLKNKPVEVKTEVVKDAKQQERIEHLEMLLKTNKKIIEQRDESIKELTSQVSIANSQELAKFKVLFENVQTEIITMKNLIDKIPEDKKEGCRKALQKVGEWLC